MDNKFLIPASIVLAGVIIGGAVIYTTGTRELKPAQVVEDGGNAGAKIVLPGVDDDVILGEVDAPVTIVEFGDFECPFCKRMHDDAGKQIRAEYVKTGKVRMVYRDFPLSFHPSAVPAAEAAGCAQDQGKFWEYHDALFERQAQISTIDYVALAGTLGMNTASFKSCVDTRKYKAEVEADYQAGIAAGVDGTPASFVNGQFVSGAQPYSVFKAAIEKALSEVK